MLTTIKNALNALSWSRRFSSQGYTGGADLMSDKAKLGSDGYGRPHVWLKSFVVGKGTRIDLDTNEMIIIVGPNNAGKSALLRECHARVVKGEQLPIKILSEVKFEFKGGKVSTLDWLRTVSKITIDGNFVVPMVGTVSPYSMEKLDRVQKYGIGDLAKLLMLYIDTEARLSASNPVDLNNVISEPPSHPFHRLYEDEFLESRMDEIFKRTFGRNLIVNRGAGRKVMLQFGDRPEPLAGKDRASNEFRNQVNSLPSIDQQGDGIRAFCGILANIIASDVDIIFVDEPEAFLHPPHSYALGRVLAHETPDSCQLLLSTHSSDLLRGILDVASPRVRIIRIERKEDVNYVKELSQEMIRSVWGDPVLRYSKILDGLFHDGVVVCEGDSDCRFYEAMIHAVDTNSSFPDLLFVHGAGKSRIVSIVKALSAIGVPVRVVVDFDLLSDISQMKELVKSLGGDWDYFSKGAGITNSAIKKRRSEMLLSDVRSEIDITLASETGETLSDDAIKKIRALLKRGSAWGEAKKIGKEFVPNGQEREKYNEMAIDLRKIGLFLVEVGELEGFCKSVGGHGPAWVLEVLQRDLANDPDLEIARSFAKELGSNWQPNAS